MILLTIPFFLVNYYRGPFFLFIAETILINKVVAYNKVTGYNSFPNFNAFYNVSISRVNCNSSNVLQLPYIFL